MQQVISLVSEFAEACASTTGPTAVAERICVSLAAQFAGSVALVFERDPQQPIVRLVAGANVPPAWGLRSFHLSELPMLAEALQTPDNKLLTGTAQNLALVELGHSPVDAPLEVICGQVPVEGEDELVMVFLAPPAPEELAPRIAALDVARHLLAASGSMSTGDQDRSITISQIYNAKLEWERTADALPSIVAVVDQYRRVLRINRTIERWDLGTVHDAVGEDLHDVLHGQCDAQGCALAATLQRAFAQLGEQTDVAFELRDSRLRRDLSVEIRSAMGSPYRQRGEPMPRRIACIVTDVSELRRAESELQALNQSLEERVLVRTRELTEANRALREEVQRRCESEASLLKSKRDLADLSNQLVEARETERKRIAQDLHDSIGQALTATTYSLEHAQALVGRNQPAEAQRVLDTATRRLRELGSDVRSIAMNLRPAMLDDLGAVSAVRNLCREWQEVYAGIALTTDICVENEQIPPSLGTDVFRSIQELLNNVAQHAHAGQVRVAMHILNNTLDVVVSDDGAGFSLGHNRRRTDPPKLRGLRGLTERTARMGGGCDIASVPGGGTHVRLVWPLDAVPLDSESAEANQSLAS